MLVGCSANFKKIAKHVISKGPAHAPQKRQFNRAFISVPVNSIFFDIIHSDKRGRHNGDDDRYESDDGKVDLDFNGVDDEAHEGGDDGEYEDSGSNDGSDEMAHGEFECEKLYSCH